MAPLKLGRLTLGRLELGSVGLEAAKRAERRLGPAMGLRSYRALLGAANRSIALEAFRGACRCALALDDSPDFDDLAQAWERCGDETAEVAVICRALVRQGRGDAALRLAEAEVSRSGSARAWYLLARVRDQLGDAEAREAFERASQAEASGEEDDEAVRSARAALVERAFRAGGLEGGFDDGGSLEDLLADGREPQRLVAAVVALRSSSKYRRASALSVLAELTEGSVGRDAVAFAARHADARGLALSWVEAERVEAVLRAATWLDDDLRDRALRRLRARQGVAMADQQERDAALAEALAPEPGGPRHLDLARAVARGEAVDPEELAIAAGVPAPAAHALVAVDALRRGEDREAARALLALVDDPGDPPVAGAYAAARLALSRSAQRDRACTLVDRLLAAEGGPPRGWLPLVDALLDAEAKATADRVLERAVGAGEAGAVERRLRKLVRRGWEANERGDREEAIALMSQAKRLSERSSR
jgi:hypothetical protein